MPLPLGSRTNWNFPIPWRKKKQFPVGGETSSPARNRNRLLIVAPPRRALPKLVLGILIDYTGSGLDGDDNDGISEGKEQILGRLRLYW